jgi:hypothetical protein
MTQSTTSLGTTSFDTTIDISKPSEMKDRGSARPTKLPSSFLKSLGPALKKLPSRDLSNSSASTVATDFFDNEDDYQYDISLQEAGSTSAHDIGDHDWELGTISRVHEHQIDEDGTQDAEDDDEYIVSLSDSSTTRTRLIDEARSCPKRREMLMDDFHRTLWEECGLVGRGPFSVL